MSKIMIIGSGFSSMAAAAFLAKAGMEVTVLEKNSMEGGRAQIYKADGFTFDMGPSWYWMPDVFERFFNLFNQGAQAFQLDFNTDRQADGIEPLPLDRLHELLGRGRDLQDHLPSGFAKKL